MCWCTLHLVLCELVVSFLLVSVYGQTSPAALGSNKSPNASHAYALPCMNTEIYSLLTSRCSVTFISSDHPARSNSTARAMARQGRVMRLTIIIAIVAVVVAQRDVDEELLQRPSVEQGNDHQWRPCQSSDISPQLQHVSRYVSLIIVVAACVVP